MPTLGIHSQTHGRSQWLTPAEWARSVSQHSYRPSLTGKGNQNRSASIKQISWHHYSMCFQTIHQQGNTNITCSHKSLTSYIYPHVHTHTHRDYHTLSHNIVKAVVRAGRLTASNFLPKLGVADEAVELLRGLLKHTGVCWGRESQGRNGECLHFGGSKELFCTVDIVWCMVQDNQWQQICLYQNIFTLAYAQTCLVYL